MMPRQRKPTDDTPSTAPRTSGMPLAVGSLDSTSRRRPNTQAARPRGPFTKKMARQSTWSTRTLPSTGPAAAASPPIAPHTPMAADRRSTGELGEDEGERRRQHEGAAHRLQDATGDEEPGAGGEAAERRRGDEDGEAGEEDAAPADAVGDAPGGEEGGGEGDVVAREHPRQLGPAGPVELLEQGGEGDVHDRDVERHQVRRSRCTAAPSSLEPAPSVPPVGAGGGPPDRPTCE
jgi:hypothetical protein